MKLNISERVALLGVLPSEGNIVTLRIIRELQGRLSFTEQELKQYSLKNTVLPDGNVSLTWNPKLASRTKDIEIGETANSVIVGQLKKLSDQNKLQVNMVPLYERFVEKPEKGSS